MLPNVKVNITEEVNLVTSKLNTFLPLVILKTKTGPIGTEVLVSSAKSFTDTFGTPDADTPEAFGILQYIKNYGGAYIVRVAGTSAAVATGTITVDDTDLISVTSKYKTEELNGVTVKLVHSSADNKLFIECTLGNKLVTSVKETISYKDATADALEKALNKVVNSFNEAQTVMTVTNLFVGKTADDGKPSSLAGAEIALAGGISGNAGVTDKEVLDAIENYRESDLGIDAILTPGFESVEVVQKLVSVASSSSFLAIASISGSSSTQILAVANTYPASADLALYADKVYLTEDPTIPVPACIAVLPAYITKDKTSKWLAPAGVTRATLSLVSGLVNKLNDSGLEELYINNIPVNGIKKISGRGYIVWGQKTTSQDVSQYQDRINVVRLIKYLTKEVYAISYDYLFEPINEYTYNSWKLRVEAILDEVKIGNGLDDYKVVMDDTINTEETKKANKLVGIVRFRPLEAAEYIEINFVVTDEVETEGGNE